MSHTGRREGGPAPLGVQVADVGGGSFGVITGMLAAVIERQAQADECVEPLLTAAETLDHPQTRARGLVVDVPMAAGGTQQQIGSPFEFSNGEPSYSQIGTTPDTHTDEVLSELGYTAEQIAALRADGALSSSRPVL